MLKAVLIPPTSTLPPPPYPLSCSLQVPIYCDDLVTARYLDIPGSGYGQPQHQGQQQLPNDGGYDQQQQGQQQGQHHSSNDGGGGYVQRMLPAAAANGRPPPPSGPSPPPPWYNMLQSLMEAGHPVSSAPWGVQERVTGGGGAGQEVAGEEAAKKLPPKGAESRIKAAVQRDRLRGRGRQEDAAIEVMHRPR